MRRGAVLLLVKKGPQPNQNGGPIVDPVLALVITNPSATNVNALAGDTLQCTCTTQTLTQTVTGRYIVWSSSNPAAATINAVTGLITAIGAGTTVITATCEGQSDTFSYVVTNPTNTVVSIDLTPANPAITGVNTVLMTAIPRDAGGLQVNGRTAVWGSGTPGHATVGPDSGTTPHTALVTGVAPGTSLISVTIDGITVSTTVTDSASNATFPHEPAGANLLRQHPFNGTIGGSVAIAGQWAVVAGSALSLVAYANSPLGTGKTGRMHYDPTVPAAGSGPGNIFASPNITEVSHLYMAYWILLSSPWSNTKDGSTSGGFKVIFNQIHYLGAAPGFGNNVFTFLSSPSEHGTIHHEVWLQGLASQLPAGQNLNLFANVPGNTNENVITPGVLAMVEVELIMNTPGSFDGIVNAWCAKDWLNTPTLIQTHAYTNVSFCTAGNTAKFCDPFWNPTKGGAGWGPVNPAPGPPISQAQNMDIPHMRFSGL